MFTLSKQTVSFFITANESMLYFGFFKKNKIHIFFFFYNSVYETTTEKAEAPRPSLPVLHRPSQSCPAVSMTQTLVRQKKKKWESHQWTETTTEVLWWDPLRRPHTLLIKRRDNERIGGKKTSALKSKNADKLPSEKAKAGRKQTGN